MKSVINWFEIPAKDFGRAIKFYSAILAADIAPAEGMGMQMAFFPMETEGEGIGGAIVASENHIPSDTGTMVYLNGGDDLNVVLGRVEAAGGRILMPKTSIGEFGFISMFIDSEGNKVGLHSMG